MTDVKSGALAHLIGQSAPFRRAVALISRIARYDAPVLIQGETGTGKELAARAIHYLSSRSAAPFVPLNCGAVPEALIETELFGCERGAYTDARQARSGLVEAAETGTLFLDEIDSLPLRAQAALLRFLQDRRYRTVGGQREILSKVRVVAAAGPRLQSLLASGAFRDDLAFRLNVLHLEMPPLRERPGDALLLAQHFVERCARHHGVPMRRLDAQGRHWVESYAWPGNVRELDNLVQRALLLSDGETLDLCAQLTAQPSAPLPMRSTLGECGQGAAIACLGSFSAARAEAVARFEREYLERVMAATEGNVTQAARLAGKERRALGKLLKKHGMDRNGQATQTGANA